MNQKQFWISIILLFLLNQVSSQLLTRQQVLDDLDELQTQFEKFHSGYTRYTYKEQLDDLFQEIRSNSGPTSVIDFYKDVTLVTSKIRCGHTRPSLPDKSRQTFIMSNVFLPFTIYVLDDKLYVSRSLDPALQPGNEIISINDLPVADILEEIFKHLSSDGFIRSGKTRITELYFHYYFQLYLAKGSESYQLALANSDKTISVSGRNWDEIETISHSSPRNPSMSLGHEDNYSYLRIGTFGASSLRNNGFDYEAFLANSFKELRDRNVKNLILDLRGNGGGRDQFGALLVSYFLSEPFGYFERIEVTDDYDGYGNINKTENYNLMTSHAGLSEQSIPENNFPGKLFLLTDGWTFSTAADVVSVIDNANRALIVGEETGGGRFGNTSGVSKRITLPNSNIRINLPMWKYTTALSEKVDDGRGVIPDIRIVPTIQQQLSGEDIALNYCLQLIRDNH